MYMPIWQFLRRVVVPCKPPGDTFLVNPDIDMRPPTQAFSA